MPSPQSNSSPFRTFVVLLFFALWWGGLTFYALVVVPVGTTVLDSPVAQGAVTQTVTVWLNRIGWLTLMVFAWDVLQAATRWRVRLTLMLFGIQFTLLLVHHQLDGLFDTPRRELINESRFRLWHITYLWLTTVQWVLGMVWLWLHVKRIDGGGLIYSGTSKDA